MANEHLITAEQFKKLARPTSKHVDDEDIGAFIRECEDILIIPAIGLERYKGLLGEELTKEQTTLLEGGEYKDRDNVLQQCAGLQKSLSYFVYAKMIQADGGMLTRTGMMQHNDSYASRGDDKNRVRRYDEAMNVAEQYLNTCLKFIKATEDSNVKAVRGTRVRIHSIGD